MAKVRVSVSYPLSIYLSSSRGYDKVISSCAKKYNLEEYGSGAGLGMRDMNFGGTKKNAESFNKSITKLKKDIKVEIWNEE